MYIPEFRTVSFPYHLLRVRSGTFMPQNFQTGFEAVLSSYTGVGGFIQQRWACELELIDMAREAWQEWVAFVAGLAGQSVAFEIPHPMQDLPLGAGGGYAATNSPLTITGTTITGTNIVQGSTTALIAQAAERYANAVLMKFDASQASTLVFKKGDVFGLGGNLYIVQAAVTTDANAQARVPFTWKLWKPAAVNDLVTTRSPTCRMQFATANQGLASLTSPDIADTGFEALEIPHTQ